MKTFTSHCRREDVADILIAVNDLVQGESLRIEITWRSPKEHLDLPDVSPADLMMIALCNDLHESEFSRDVVSPYEV